MVAGSPSLGSAVVNNLVHASFPVCLSSSLQIHSLKQNVSCCICRDLECSKGVRYIKYWPPFTKRYFSSPFVLFVQLQYHAGLASGLLNQQSLKRSANQMGVSAKRRPKAQPTTLVLPPQWVMGLKQFFCPGWTLLGACFWWMQSYFLWNCSSFCQGTC